MPTQPDTTGCGGPGSSGDLREILSARPDWDVTTVHIYSVDPSANVSTFLESVQSNTMCQRAATQRGWLSNSSLKATPMWNGEGGESYLTTGSHAHFSLSHALMMHLHAF